MRDYNKDDILALVDRLDDSRPGLRRLAADYLMQTEQGKNELRRLFREDTGRIQTVFNTMPSECLGKITGKYSPKFSKSYLRIARSCPICGTSPKNLRWIFNNFVWGDCPQYPMMDFNGWISVCDNCSIQIDRFRLEDTPPEVLATPELHPAIRTLTNENSSPEEIYKATQILLEHGYDGLSRLILCLGVSEPHTSNADRIINAITAFDKAYFEILVEYINDSSRWYKINLIQVFKKVRYVEGIKQLSQDDEQIVRDAAVMELEKFRDE